MKNLSQRSEAPARPDGPRERRRHVVPALLALCTVASFIPVLRAEFTTWDDPGYVYENPTILSGLNPRTVAWAFTTFQESNWHPLTWLSHALDVTLFGLNAPAHHAMNLLIHVASTLLLFAAFERMTGDRWKSAFVALVFGIHPLHVESVAWISERKDVLSALLMMLTIRSYAEYAITGRRADYLRAAGWFALGLLAKPMLVTIPFVLLLLDAWPLGRLAGPSQAAGTRAPLPLKALIAEKAPFLALAAASSIVTFIAQRAGGAVSALGPLPFADRAANAVVSYGAYVLKTLWPTDLSFFYPHRMEAIGGTEIAFSALALAAVTIAAWRARRRHRYLFVGWAIFAGMLVPVIGLVQVGLQAMADRYMYLPIIGLSVAAAWGFPALLGRGAPARMFLRAGFIATGIAMGVLTWNQAEIWHDSDSLYAHGLAVTEGNHIAHTNIGVTLMERGMNAEAIPHFKEALRLWPRNNKNFSNLARALAAVGRFEEALPLYRKILGEVDPNPLLHVRVGDVFTGLGRQDSALAHYERAVAIDSTMTEAHVAIADIASSRSDFARARESLRKVFALVPGSARAHDMLGIVAGRERRFDEAEEEFRKAIAADSTDEQGYIDLGILCEKTGRTEEARRMYEAAVRVNPRSVTARVRLGTAMAQAGDYRGAEGEWLACLQIAPPAVEARMNLARLYTMQAKRDEAMAQYLAVIRARPSGVDARYLLGQLLGSRGDIEGAKRMYREALELEPGFVEAATALSLLEAGGK